jgi:hypothetical protein
MEQLELFDVATHYPFELTHEFESGWKSAEEVDYNAHNSCSCDYYWEFPNHLTDWSKP